MKGILISIDYGGFEVRDDYFRDFMKRTGGLDDIREDPVLIEMVEKGRDIGALFSEIGVVYIPDTATDYDVIEYDGKEWVVYVLD